MFRSCRPLFRLAVCLVILTAGVLSVARPVAAQSQARGNLMVRVSTAPTGNNKPPSVYVATFVPGNAVPVNHVDIANTNSFFVIAPNGQWIVMTEYDANGGINLSYGQLGKPLGEIQKDKAYDVIFPVFSTDSRFLAFGLANLQPQKWQFEVIELATGKSLLFGGDYVLPPAPKPPAGFYGGPLALAFSADGKHVYINTIAPQSDGTLGGPYNMDLSQFTFGQAGILTVPTVRQVGNIDTSKTPFFPGLFSPDATKVIFVSYDQSRPVPNYAGMG